MIESVKDISSLPNNPKDGSVVYVEDTQKMMRFSNNNWDEIKYEDNGSGIQMSLYDFNKQVIKQLPIVGWEVIEKTLSGWVSSETNNYFLLYGKEIGYFTLFKRNDKCGASLFEGLKECLSNVGEIHGFDITNDNAAIEIWALDKDLNDMTCLYFFGYDEGIVEFG